MPTSKVRADVRSRAAVLGQRPLTWPPNSCPPEPAVRTSVPLTRNAARFRRHPKVLPHWQCEGQEFESRQLHPGIAGLEAPGACHLPSQMSPSCHRCSVGAAAIRSSACEWTYVRIVNAAFAWPSHAEMTAMGTPCRCIRVPHV